MQNKSKEFNYRIAFLIAILTIIVCMLEAFVSIKFGLKSDSLTLFGFGIDSFIEVISSIGIAHMVLRIQYNPDEIRDKFEKTALKITGYSFYILTAGLIFTSIYNLYTGSKPKSEFSGIIISLASILVMLVLIYAKIKLGKSLKSDAILSDAECSKVCVYTSIILLVSSGVYELLKIPFIDTIGTLGIAYLAFKEGKECFQKILLNSNCSCENKSFL